MSKDDGTPLCTNGQLATVASRIITALPKAIEDSGLDIKSILSHTGKGERLSLAISAAFKMLYNGDMAIIPIRRSFPIWKIIRLGTGPKMPKEHRDALKKAGVRIDEISDYLLGNINPPAEEISFELVVLSPRKLGFTTSIDRYSDVFAKAQAYGLERCSTEVVFSLLLQHSAQIKHKKLVVAVKSGCEYNGKPFMFYIFRNDGAMYLRCDIRRPILASDIDTPLLFCRRK